MKRILIFFLVIGITAISSVSMAAMSNSRIRKETRFLTDKMAYELNLSTGQYNDVYEINYDFIYSIRYLMDDVIRGEEWALDKYYRTLDIRNDDLRWVLTASQYRRFIGVDYIDRFMPVVAVGVFVSIFGIQTIIISTLANRTTITAIAVDTIVLIIITAIIADAIDMISIRVRTV